MFKTSLLIFIHSPIHTKLTEQLLVLEKNNNHKTNLNLTTFGGKMEYNNTKQKNKGRILVNKDVLSFALHQVTMNILFYQSQNRHLWNGYLTIPHQKTQLPKTLIGLYKVNLLHPQVN